MKKIVLFIIIALCFLTTACQATPEKQIVVSKNDEKMEEILGERKNSEEYEIPKNWEEEFIVENLKCNINAEIIVPKDKKYPSYEVKKGKIPKKTGERILEYLAKGAVEMRVHGRSKEELTQRLIEAKRGVYIETDGVSELIVDYEGKEERIAQLEREIKAAKEFVYEPIITKDYELPFDKVFRYEDGKERIFLINNDLFIMDAGNNSVLQYESWLIEDGGYPDEGAITEIKTNVDKNSALKIAEDFLKEVGLTKYMNNNQERARVISDENSHETISTGWVFNYVRNDGNYPKVDYDNIQKGETRIVDDEEELDYAEMWSNEYIYIYVSENGIEVMNWANPMEITETINESTNILPFEEVKEKIKNSLKYGFSNHSGELYIDKIMLTNVNIPVKDDLSHQYLIPMWVVYYKFNIDKEPMVYGINAITGATISLNSQM